MRNNNKSLNNFERLSVPVEGMTCASCVARVEKSISKIEGIKNVSVNLATEKATFEIDKTKTNLNQVRESVEDAGYRIDLSSLNKKSGDYVSSVKPDYLDNYRKELKNHFLLALILTIPVFLLSLGTMWSDFTKVFPLAESEINKILMLLTTPVILISGRNFYKIFWKNLKHHSADMNSLVAIGTGSAYTFSVLITLFPELFHSHSITSHVYFDTAAVIITLILMGRWFESHAKSRTGLAIKKLIELKPYKVIINKNNLEIEIGIEELNPGDIVIIKPGSKIPADGKIIKGYSTVDESMITGESLPVEKNVGSKIIGGTFNRTGSFEFTVTAIGDNSILGQIIKLVENAQGSKAPIQKIADKIASIFVPVIIGIALITFLCWLYFSSEGINYALVNFVAVLIIACPCALGLATPTALIVGTGIGAQKGILIKNTESLELAHKIDTIIFDKTGTITTGKFVVSFVKATNNHKNTVIKFAASIGQKSEHPISKAILNYAMDNRIEITEPESFESLTGFGIKGTVNGEEVIAGNISLMENSLVNLNEFENVIRELSESGKTIILVAINRQLAGIITVEDSIKKNATEVIKKIKSLGLKTIMLTGDNQQAAKKIADETGIDEFRAEVLPDDKIKIVSEYQEKGKIVGMVGDGINDAPALAKSDVGIAIGTGTDIAIESADIVLPGGDLNGVADSIKLSRLTLRTIKQNLFWAFVYNIIGVPLAALGLLNPMVAALAMSFSSISVVTNSLLLKKKRF